MTTIEGLQEQLAAAKNDLMCADYINNTERCHAEKDSARRRIADITAKIDLAEKEAAVALLSSRP